MHLSWVMVLAALWLCIHCVLSQYEVKTCSTKNRHIIKNLKLKLTIIPKTVMLFCILITFLKQNTFYQAVLAL